MAFRAYTLQEIRDAAEAFDVDPDFAIAIYNKESSAGKNPDALTVRKVDRKKSGPTFVRGPFQLEDETTNGIIRNNKLSDVDINDPDTHLQLAMLLIRELTTRHNGDLHKVAQSYLGPGGSDMLGSTPRSYADQVMADYRKLKGTTETAPGDNVFAGPPTAPSGAGMLPDLGSPMGGGSEAMPADDMFGIPAMPAVPASSLLPKHPQVPLDPLGLPMYITAATQPRAQDAPKTDYDELIRRLVDEELQGKEYASG